MVWVIVRESSGEYFAGTGAPWDGVVWTLDRDQATRFTDQADAEQTARCLEVEVWVPSEPEPDGYREWRAARAGGATCRTTRKGAKSVP